MNPGEEGLIQGINSGDEKAFEELFNTHYPELCAYALRYMPDYESAEEIVQDLFVQLWNKREDLKLQRSLKSYLFGSVKNNCLDYLKHEKVKQKYINKVLSYSGKDGYNNYETYISKETIERIYNAVEALPGQRKKVFKMSRFEGLKYKEIALNLNISEKTVEHHMGSALSQLREILSDLLS